jgi:hypothetical protein
MGGSLALRTVAGIALVSLTVCLAGAQTASDAERARLWSQFYDGSHGRQGGSHGRQGGSHGRHGRIPRTAR